MQQLYQHCGKEDFFKHYLQFNIRVKPLTQHLRTNFRFFKSTSIKMINDAAFCVERSIYYIYSSNSVVIWYRHYYINDQQYA